MRTPTRESITQSTNTKVGKRKNRKRKTGLMKNVTRF